MGISTPKKIKQYNESKIGQGEGYVNLEMPIMKSLSEAGIRKGYVKDEKASRRARKKDTMGRGKSAGKCSWLELLRTFKEK